MTEPTRPNTATTSTFDRKCDEVAKRLDMPVDQVVAVFDAYEAITVEWGRAAGDSGRAEPGAS